MNGVEQALPRSRLRGQPHAVPKVDAGRPEPLSPALRLPESVLWKCHLCSAR